MMFRDFRLNSDYKGPIYKQIAENIEQLIKNGSLPAGYKLPTVRELSDEIGAACGTIKHAYDLLEEQGYVVMIQGSGSFVTDRSDCTMSRKEQAMAAIDEMFLQMEKLGFTPREMEIYLNLKLRALEEKYDVVRVAIVDCNPETLQLMQNQLSQIGYAETVAFDLNRIEDVADKLNSDYDIILTTPTHFTQIEPYINPEKTVGMLAMTPSVRTIISLAQIADDKRVGIFCASDAFSGVVRSNCANMGAWCEELTTQLMGISGKAEQFFENQDVIIVPEGYEAFVGTEEKELLHSFCENGGVIVPYSYRIDKGSFLYVQEQIKRIMNKKRSI